MIRNFANLILGLIIFSSSAHSQTWIPVAAVNTDINDIINYDLDIWVGGNNLTAKWTGINLVNYNLTSGEVVQMAVDGALQLYAVGDIYINNTPQVAKWDQFQEEWMDLPGVSESQTGIYSTGGTLYVGTASGGVYSSSISLVNFSPFSTSFTGSSPKVNCFIEYHDTLYAAGSFTHYDGLPVGPIVKWDGASWKRPTTSINVSGTINCMAVYNGELYAGGKFFLSNGSAFHIAKWNGLTWTSVGGGITAGTNGVKDMLVFQNDLYIAGDFTAVGGVPAKNVARWDGSSWHSLGFTGTTGYLSCLESESFIGP